MVSHKPGALPFVTPMAAFACSDSRPSTSTTKSIAAIELSDADRADALRRVQTVFDLFEGWVDELLVYAKATATAAVESTTKKPLQRPSHAPQESALV